MALEKGVNSYVSLVEAMAYFDDRLDASAWIDAPELLRSQALVTATSLLDMQSFIGTVVSEEQPLAFPRDCTYYDPKLGTEVYSSGVPKRIMIATYELAYHLLNNDGLLDQTGEVTSVNVSSIALSNVRKAPILPDTVLKQIRPLLSKGDTGWWRAN